MAEIPGKNELLHGGIISYDVFSGIGENGIAVFSPFVGFKNARNLEILADSGVLAFAEERLHPNGDIHGCPVCCFTDLKPRLPRVTCYDGALSFWPGVTGFC